MGCEGRKGMNDLEEFGGMERVDCCVVVCNYEFVYWVFRMLRFKVVVLNINSKRWLWWVLWC